MGKEYITTVESPVTGHSGKIYLLKDIGEYVIVPDGDPNQGERLDLLMHASQITARLQGITPEMQLSASYIRN